MIDQNRFAPGCEQSIENGAYLIGSEDSQLLEGRTTPTRPARLRMPSRRPTSTSVATLSTRKTRLGIGRRALGICLMLLTIFFWTASNFIASSIFADDTYSKPYFVTWINVAFFSLFLTKPLFKSAWRQWRHKLPFLSSSTRYDPDGPIYSPVGTSFGKNLSKPDEEDRDRQLPDLASSSLMLDDSMVLGFDASSPSVLSFRSTARLAFQFFFVWFVSNFFVSACLQYTTVASSTVLNSTSSAFTLAFGALLGAERFTLRKLAGVAICLLGVLMISQVDLSGKSDENRGSFPEKSALEMAIGDVLALLAAMFYGLYTILLKKRIGDESRLDVFTFFGLIGLFDLLLVWPGLVAMHLTGLEEFELPPTGKIWGVIVINGAISVVSDVAWTYSMLLTSPLVITVGLSLAIPLSLLGQMIINGQSSSLLYWVGSVVVVISFLVINDESRNEAAEADEAILHAEPVSSVIINNEETA